jgi:hypothetical protein
MISSGDIVALLTGGALEDIGGLSLVPVLSTTPTALDVRMMPKVAALLVKYGKNAIFKVTGNTYDATSGAVVPDAVLQYVKKVIPPFTAELKYVDGTLTKTDDLFTGVAAKDIEFTPIVGMSVLLDNWTYKIERVMPIYTGEWIVLYIMQLRK